MARAGLFAKQGLFLGRFGGRYLVLGGQQGVLLSAPPRAEKGTAIVVPNLLFWQGSVLCLDVKLENWTLTAGTGSAPASSAICFIRWRRMAIPPAGIRSPISRPIPIFASATCSASPPFSIPMCRGRIPSGPPGHALTFLGVTMYVLETPSLPPTLGEVLAAGHGLRHGRIRPSLAADHRGAAEGTLSLELAVRAGALRDHRPGARDRVVHSQDLYLALGPFREPAPGPRDLAERF